MCAIHKPLESKQNSTRLADTVRPSFYKIKVTPDIAGATFAGEQTITLTLAEPVSEIVLHAAELDITRAVLRNEKGSSFTGSVSINEERQEATIKLDGTAGMGEWFLDLSFTGILNNKLRGFYRSSFKDADGKEKFVATTKFEPSDARRAFPCFDEPKFKAIFEIQLVIDKNLTAISNSPIVSEKDADNGKKLVSFAPSIKMSSYLVCYVVGEFESSEMVKAKSGAEIRIWSVPGKKHLTPFAMRWAKFSLDYFADYFGIDYPAPKLDLIAIPDFASGAMENFGAITFRETALLLDEAKATHKELLRVAEVISHENAHMWFGDLVTMDWWNGLWLNEAFATFMAAKAVHAFEPSWRFWEGFNIEKAGAMRIDGLHASRSIEFPVATPEDARAMFDVLTYEKGCAILRMLELYIGEDVFRKGCSIYMAKHAYGNTETADLWKALDQAVKEASLDISVGKMMDTWVYQKGFPLVSVDLADSQGSIVLRQNAFRYLSQDGDGKEQLWYIPVSIRAVTADGAREECFALTEKERSFYVGEGLSSVVVNAEGKGFFRVNYSLALREKLLGNLKSLSASERFNLVSDLWASTLAAKLSLADYLKSLKIVLADETDNNVFSVITGSLSYLRRICRAAAPEKQASFVSLAKELLEPALNRLGWEAKAGETPQEAELRASLVSTLGSFGEADTRSKVAGLWSSHLAKPGSVNANLLPAVVETTATQGDQACYEQFLQLKEKASTPQEESRYLHALSSFQDSALIARTLEATLNGQIKTQDAPAILRSLFMNPEGGQASWNFLKQNWDKLVAAYPLQGIIRLCDGITALVDPTLEAEISEFFATRNIKGNEKALAQNLETLKIANRFLQREGSQLKVLLN